jgi:glycosyltransferase involved in cell wall biosynthesis
MIHCSECIPVLMITHNRLAYTKKALEALFNSKGVQVYIIDNASTDGTVEWLESQPWKVAWNIIFNKENRGIADAMNQFLELTKYCNYVGKADNDTLIPQDWAEILLNDLQANNLDIIQAKHPIIPATHPQGWDGFVSNMEQPSPGIFLNHFVGGSGIIFRRDKIHHIPQTEWVLGGWRQFQREHPELKKAFTDHVEVELLDAHGYTDFPDYYKRTKRLV